MLYWRRSKIEDVGEIAPYVREIERIECRDMSGEEDMAAVLSSAVSMSDPCHTLVADDGSLLGMCGVTPLSPGLGVVWLLPTERCFEGANRIQFIRLTRRWIAERVCEYPVLCNYIHASNELSVRWLHWAGCQFVACKIVNNSPYLLFTRKANV